MKFIRIYIEVGNDGNPIYANEFVEFAKDCNNILIGSREYIALLSEDKSTNVIMIPNEIMEKYDQNLQNKSSRYIMMKIFNNDELENWIDNQVSMIDDINGIYLRGEYSSVIMAARKKNVPVFIQNEVKPLYDESDKERNYQLIVDTLERRIDYLETSLSQSNETIASMKETIESNNNYIENLQYHATNLDNDLKKYQTFYDEHYEDIESIDEKLNYAEKEVQKYVELYKNILKELDEIKTEKLDLEQKLGKK